MGNVFLGVAAAADPAVLGIELTAFLTALITWCDTHVHVGNLGAPTMVPTVLSTASLTSLLAPILSKVVKLV
jgi:hypothetical protein